MSVSQINSSYQSALSGANYSGSTTSAQAKADLEYVLSSVIAVDKATQSLPTSNVTAGQLEAIAPQDVTLVTSIAKATSSLRNLSSPLSPEEGDYLLTTLQNIQAVIAKGLPGYAARNPACEAAVPGLNDLNYKTRKNLTNSLIEALSGALPYDAQQSTLKKLKSSIEAALESAHA